MQQDAYAMGAQFFDIIFRSGFVEEAIGLMRLTHLL
jgi:hypothetical protein